MTTSVAEAGWRESRRLGPLTWGELLRGLVADGLAANVATWVVEEAMGVRSAERLCRLGEPVPASARRRVEGWCERLLSGEPLAYVLGHWSFWDVELAVGPGVLVPRPETEVLVEVALEAAARAGLDGTRGSDVVVDLGTGSGAIAVALARELRRVVLATERSAVAAGWARRNVARLGATVEIREGEWWEALPSGFAGRIGLAVANPPYVSAAEMARLPRTVAAFEPVEALFGGESGLEATEAILSGAERWLAPGGLLVLELAEARAGLTAARAEAAGLRPLGLHRDLAGRPRVLVLARPDRPEHASSVLGGERRPQRRRAHVKREADPFRGRDAAAEPVIGCDRVPLDRVPLERRYQPGAAPLPGAGERGLGEAGAGSAKGSSDAGLAGARRETRLEERR